MIAENAVSVRSQAFRQLRVRPNSRTDILAAAGAVIIITLVSLPSLLYPLGVDQAMFAYVGDVWLKGGLPYRDAWDIKPPGIYAIYALAQALFGHNMSSIRIADLISVLLTSAGLFALLRHRATFKFAALGSALFGIAYYTIFPFDATAQAESFALPLMVGVVYAVLNGRGIAGWKWPAIAGIQVGLLTLLKTPYALFLFFAWFVLWGGSVGRGFWKDQAALLTASLVPVMAVAAYFLSRGALGELIGTLAIQRAYASTPGIWVPRWIMFQFWDFFEHRLLISTLLGIGLCGLASRSLRSRIEARVAAGWLCLATLLILIQWRCFNYHFVLLLPPLAFLAAITLHDFRKSICEPGRRVVIPLTTGLVAILVVAPLAMDTTRLGFALAFVRGQISQDSFWGCFNTGQGQYPFNNAANVAKYLRSHSAPGDTILVYDYDPAIYYLSGLRSASRHLSVAPIYIVRGISRSLRRHWLRQQLEDVTLNPPAYLIVAGRPKNYGMTDSADGTPETIHFGRADYEYQTSFTKEAIYRRTAAKVASPTKSGPWNGLLVAEPPLL